MLITELLFSRGSRLTLSVEYRYVIGGQAIFCLDPDEQRRAPPRGHALTWEGLRLEAQREGPFLQRDGRNAVDFQTRRSHRQRW